MDPLLRRHVDSCNDAVIPGPRQPFKIGRLTVGYVLPGFACLLHDYDAITQTDDSVVLSEDQADALPGIAEDLGRRGECWIRGEAFDVRATPDGPALSRIDRGALPKFGIQAVGVHVNGLVRIGDALHVWIARRARHKKLDPGKLDHIVAGGVSAGMSPAQTVIKEAAEEAGLAPELSSKAREVSRLTYAMDRPEGLRRDVLYCYDLDLRPDFIPKPADGEVEAFELWDIGRVIQAVRQTDDFKFNVALVLVDLFGRLNLA